MKKFLLIYNVGGNKEPIKFGTMSFNGKFVFELEKDISYDLWKKVGIIQVNPKTRKIESKNLFSYINARLPIMLRKESVKAKMDYIEKSQLKVPSDRFTFVPLN